MATAMAGVNMRLKPGAVRYATPFPPFVVFGNNALHRELHWHSTAEVSDLYHVVGIGVIMSPRRISGHM